MSNDYGTTVKLIAVTRTTQILGNMAKPHPAKSDGETLIEYASRLCVAKEGETGAGTNYIKDRIEQGHESVLEHASLTVHIMGSRAFTHELVRHRIASFSQRSQRYVNESSAQYITPPELSKHDGIFSDRQKAELFERAMEDCWRAYRGLLSLGTKPEIARYVLPNACQTQIIVTMNYRELRHFIKLRTSPRCLPEMREIASKVRDICVEVAPQVFDDLRKEA